MGLPKGRTNNKNGRPKKGETLTDALRDMAMKNKDELAAKLIEMAFSGDGPSMRYVFDRLDGTPKQTQDINMNANVSIDTEFELVDPDEVPQDLVGNADTEKA